MIILHPDHAIQIYAGHKPFSDLTEMQISSRIMRNDLPERPSETSSRGKSEHMPDALWDLLVRCWAQNPNQRPNMQTVAEGL